MGRLYDTSARFAVVTESVLYSEISDGAFRLWVVLRRHGSPDGRSFPGIKRLAHLLRVDRRTVQRRMRELEAAGLVRVEQRSRPDGGDTSNDYYLSDTPKVGEGGADATGDGGVDATPDCGVDATPKRNENQKERKPVLNPARRQNPIWDTLVDIFGPPTEAARSMYGKVVRSLTDAGATPDEIRRRASVIVEAWGPSRLTVTSLEKHWAWAGSQAAGLVGVSSDKLRTQADLRRFLAEHAGDDGGGGR